MSKTEEEIFHNKLVHYNPRQFPKGIKNQIYKAMKEFSDQQSSSKDARIKELEDENNGMKEQRQNDMMLASSAVNQIKELEARLEKAEKLINLIKKRNDEQLLKTSSRNDHGELTITNLYIDGFLTNKTE